MQAHEQHMGAEPEGDFTAASPVVLKYTRLRDEGRQVELACESGPLHKRSAALSLSPKTRNERQQQTMH